MTRKQTAACLRPVLLPSRGERAAQGAGRSALARGRPGRPRREARPRPRSAGRRRRATAHVARPTCARGASLLPPARAAQGAGAAALLSLDARCRRPLVPAQPRPALRAAPLAAPRRVPARYMKNCFRWKKQKARSAKSDCSRAAGVRAPAEPALSAAPPAKTRGTSWRQQAAGSYLSQHGAFGRNRFTPCAWRSRHAPGAPGVAAPPGCAWAGGGGAPQGGGRSLAATDRTRRRGDAALFGAAQPQQDSPPSNRAPQKATSVHRCPRLSRQVPWL